MQPEEQEGVLGIPSITLVETTGFGTLSAQEGVPSHLLLTGKRFFIEILHFAQDIRERNL
jgi:hypothetical protein